MTNNPSIAVSKRQLRQQLRQQRRALTQPQQALAARQLYKNVVRLVRFQRARHVACYLAADGEIDTMAIIQACWRSGKSVFLPVISGARLHFHHYRAGDRLEYGDYGLRQPRAHSKELESHHLDLVLMPLVGFDRSGGRLGMGGGYYDRAFCYRNKRSAKPFLLGLAHSQQELEQTPVTAWDKAVDAIATDSGAFKISR